MGGARVAAVGRAGRRRDGSETGEERKEGLIEAARTATVEREREQRDPPRARHATAHPPSGSTPAGQAALLCASGMCDFPLSHYCGRWAPGAVSRTALASVSAGGVYTCERVCGPP